MLEFLMIMSFLLMIFIVYFGFLSRLLGVQELERTINACKYTHKPSVNLLGNIMLRVLLFITKPLVILGGFIAVCCIKTFKFLFLKDKSCPEED